MNENEKNLSGYGFSFKDYIRILENPDKIGLNNGIWSAPILKGYDKNQRGYGIDINTNKKAKALTNNRPGRWLTEKEADTLMDDHINYITEAANKHIKGFSKLPFRRRWALLGMLYRGDSVNKSGININEPDDLKFFKSISDYYRSKGLNTRANSSDEFFNRPVSKLLSMFKLKQGGQVRKMLTAAGGPIHYSRTMDTDNLSKAANYVGGYVLKGLGALGKFLNAGFTSPTYGTIGQVSYARNTEDTKRQRELSEASEQAMGKAMTWVSPLNYGAALWNGHGLNARKGEEEVASWSPAWQAVGRLGELYFGPKAVKGVKSAPRVIVNTAAKAGVKPAKAAVVAREIKLATKNTKLNNNSTVIPHEDLFDFWHGGLESDFNFGNLDVFRKASKQSKRNRNYAGFYMYNTPRLLGAFNYGFGEAHGIKLKPDAKKLKVNFNTERIEALELQNYRNQGYDYIEGKDVWGAPEYILLNKDAIQHTGFFDHSLGHNIHILRDRNIPKVDLSMNNLPSKTSLKFFERKPSKNNIVGASYDYRMEDPKGSMDFLKQFFALLKINGKEYTLEGLRDVANVQQGLPEHIQSYLNLNTVERAVRAMRKNGYSEREIQLYIDKVNEEMNKVKVGMYSDLEYNAAGALDFGGFYNNESNFISINRDAHLKDSKFTPEYIMKHEGRHLIDYNTSMTDDVINILEKAYDKNFLEIPKHEDAGSLKDYQYMDRERVTTNRDARDVLLTSKGKYLLNKHDFIIDSSKRGYSTDMIDFLNKIIKYAQPEDIVNAVENSNGYGKRYINYLKKNNKLTPAKIEQLRLAMIHVPSYLLPVAGGYTLYNIFNQPLQQLQYQKQGGKMNILEFLKNGSGIHIKEKNKGSFTRWCGGNVTEECIRRGKNSSNSKIRKKATFADNARHFKHKKGGKVFVNGVNVLDSNPKAYKYVKKKYRMAQQGTKLNFFLKAENFLNSDFGKGILSLGSLIFNGIKTGADVANFSNSFDSATDATIKAMESKMKADSYLKRLLKAQQVIAQKQQENPDIHFGEIDLRNMALNFSNEFYDSDTIDNYKALRAQEKLLSMRAIQGSAGNNWLDAIGGIAGNLLNGKTKDNSSTSYSTSNNGGAGWTMNYNSQYGSKNKYNSFLLTGTLPKMNSVVAPNTSWLNNNPL